MSNGEVVLVILLVAMLVPVVSYLSVKLGTVAFYRGRQLFEKTKGEPNGEENET